MLRPGEAGGKNNMESLYRPILLKSWQIVKKYKFLWTLGFFAAFLGNTGDLKFFFDLTGNINNQPVIWQNIKGYFLNPDLINFLYHFNVAPLASKLFVIIFLIFFLVIFLFFIWLVISSQAGLINGVNEIDKGKAGGFKLNFNIGSKFFGPVLALNAIAKIFSLLILVLLVLPLIILTKSSPSSSVIIIIGFLIFLPLVIIINFVTKYAVAFVVLRGKRFKDSFVEGWRLFFDNWLISLEMAVIILFINLLVSLIIIIITLLIISPLFVIFFFAGETFIFYPILFFLAMLAIFIILVIYSAVLSTFQTSSWTLLFLKISKAKTYSKLERLAATSPPKTLKK